MSSGSEDEDAAPIKAFSHLSSTIDALESEMRERLLQLEHEEIVNLEQRYQNLLVEKLQLAKDCERIHKEQLTVLIEEKRKLEIELESVRNEYKELQQEYKREIHERLNVDFQLGKCKADLQNRKELYRQQILTDRLVVEAKKKEVDNVIDYTSKKDRGESSANAIDSEHLTFVSVLAGDSNPCSGALTSSGMRGEPISLGDSDDDCAPREKNPKGKNIG